MDLFITKSKNKNTLVRLMKPYQVNKRISGYVFVEFEGFEKECEDYVEALLQEDSKRAQRLNERLLKINQMGCLGKSEWLSERGF